MCTFQQTLILTLATSHHGIILRKATTNDHGALLRQTPGYMTTQQQPSSSADDVADLDAALALAAAGEPLTRGPAFTTMLSGVRVDVLPSPHSTNSTHPPY